MNGFEKQTAISMSGLMKCGMSLDGAWELIKLSDYCVDLDRDKMLVYLHDILNGGGIAFPRNSDLPEDLFEL